MHGQSWPEWPHISLPPVPVPCSSPPSLFPGALSCNPVGPGLQWHWRRIHSTTERLPATKAQSVHPGVGPQGLPVLWRTIIPHGESYFLFPLGILGLPQTPFLLTLISSEPNPQVLDWIAHPSGNKIHQVYPRHSVASQTWALFFHGFWDSVTQYSVSGLSHSKPWYILWLLKRRQVVPLWVIKACCRPCTMTKTDRTELQQSWVKPQLCPARGTERCQLSDKE